MATKKIEHKADRNRALSLAELDAFIREARQAGATGAELLHVRATWGAKVQQVSVEVAVPTPTPSLDKA